MDDEQEIILCEDKMVAWKLDKIVFCKNRGEYFYKRYVAILAARLPQASQFYWKQEDEVLLDKNCIRILNGTIIHEHKSLGFLQLPQIILSQTTNPLLFECVKQLKINGWTHPLVEEWEFAGILK